MGIAGPSGTAENRFLRLCHPAERAVCLVATLLLIIRGLVTDLLGLGGIALISRWQRVRPGLPRRLRRPRAPEAAAFSP